MASKLDKILKLLDQLDADDKEVIKEVVKDNEEKEEVETKEEPEVKETKEEEKPKVEEKKDDEESKFITKDQLEATIKSLLGGVATKEELESVTKKAKPFGTESKVDNTKEVKDPLDTDALLKVVNSNFR